MSKTILDVISSKRTYAGLIAGIAVSWLATGMLPPGVVKSAQAIITIYCAKVPTETRAQLRAEIDKVIAPNTIEIGCVVGT